MKTRGLLALALLLFTLSGCEHKELCYDHPHGSKLLIQYDWSDCGVKDVDGMSLYAYPISGALPIVNMLSGNAGGEVVLQLGSYNLLSFNNDSQGMGIRGEATLGGIEAYLEPTTITGELIGVNEPDLPECISGQELVNSADGLYQSTYYDFISNDEVGVTTVDMLMKPLVRRVRYAVRGIGNVDLIKRVRCALGGVSASIGIESEVVSNVSSAVVFDGEVVEAVVEGEFYYFGIATNDDQQCLVLFLWGDGNNLRASFDVSRLIDAAPNPYDVYIEIETDISMPEPISGDDGFNPSVNPWEESEDDNTLTL